MSEDNKGETDYLIPPAQDNEENNAEIKITLKQAFEKSGGFGSFQKFCILVSSLGNGGAAFFLNCFVFLELMPQFKCQLTQGSDKWTEATVARPLEKEFCAKEYTCEVDWSKPQSINNLIVQLDFYCQPKW